MRSQTATTTNNRKRGRESTGVSSSPVRSTRLKTGRHPPPPPRHHSLVTTAAAAALDDLIKVEDDLQTDDELVKMLRRAEEDDPATEDWDEEIISFKKKKKMMMIKKENKNLSPATVIGPPSSLSDGRGPADHDQPTPSKNRKTSLLLLQQQQQQVANGFPVTVFPPAADNNNSSPPPPPSAGPFQQRLNNNSKNSSSSRANSKPEQKPAVISRHPVKEAPPSLSSSSSSAAATRRDNNNGDEAAAAAVMVAVTSAAASIRRQQMKEAFQPWVMQTYGDAAKTKTISRRKSERIARILRGEDRSNGADSSKFRFWVRAKGFRLGATAGNSDSSSSSPSSSISSDLMSSAAEPLSATNDPSHDELYVVTSTAKDEMGGEDRPVYKKVAVVEDFFDIIYREHVEFMSNSGGRPPTGKHAGQKRTYRAITEIYAFLPREAVTRFLMQCADCQRRGNGASSVVNPPSSIGPGAAASPATNGLLPSNQGVSPGSPTPPASPHTPANVTTATVAPSAATAAKSSHHLPPTPPQSSRHASSTTTSSSSSWSQQQLRYLGLGQASPIPPTPSSSLLMGLAVTTNNIDLSLPLTSTLLKRATLAGVSHQQLLGLDRAESSFSSAGASSQHHLPARGMTAGYQMDQQEIKQNSSTPNRMTTSNATDPITLDLSSKTSDVTMCDGDHSPGTVKDEDDEDDDDVDDRIDTQDPERLKAFNMFVRLFVDENLDRMVPISRQPREKIQAIIDSCLRQFPEFGERARKRIRTYLKSCRRHKRTRDDPATPGGVGSGLLSPNRPMPSHLTSVVAEQILAQACENENQNAKRLRLGLEPISQSLPPPTANEGLANSPTTLNSQPTEAVYSSSQSSTATTPTSTTAASPGQITNLFRPAFGPYQRSNSSTNAQPVPINQGPTDLSTKSRQTPAILGPPNGLSNRSSPLQPHKLNAAEILAVRQLVTGYRESAAFLLRSADELEQLLHQQHSPL